MNSKKPYGANNWRLIKMSPDELFPTPTFEEFMEARVHSWELRDSYVSINRIYNTKTGKVTEKSYQQQGPATRFLAKHMTIENMTEEEYTFFLAYGVKDDQQLLTQEQFYETCWSQ